MPSKMLCLADFSGASPLATGRGKWVHLRTMNFLSCSIFTCDKTPQTMNHAGYSDGEFSAMKVNRKYQFT